MKIPKSFKLLGHTVTVSYEPAAFYEKNRYGACSFESKWIKLCPVSPAMPVTQSSLEHTFLHELNHMILYHCHGLEKVKGDTPLYENEPFVDFYAGLLHQALTSFEYQD
jgi:hypothetical protein